MDIAEEIIKKEVDKLLYPEKKVIVVSGGSSQGGGNPVIALIILALTLIPVVCVTTGRGNKSSSTPQFETTENASILKTISSIKGINTVPYDIIAKYNLAKDYKEEVNCIDYSFAYATYSESKVRILWNKYHCWVEVDGVQIEPQDGRVITTNEGRYINPHGFITLTEEDKQIIRRKLNASN
jgi:hypothetical protein